MPRPLEKQWHVEHLDRLSPPSRRTSPDRWEHSGTRGKIAGTVPGGNLATMHESSNDTGPSDQLRPRTWNTLLRDVLVGGSWGILMAVFWVVVAGMMASANAGWTAGLKSCLLLPALLVVVTCGVLAGYLIAETAGGVCGGVVGYLVPFVVYGVWMQRTTGSAAWFRGQHRSGETGSKE